MIRFSTSLPLGRHLRNFLLKKKTILATEGRLSADFLRLFRPCYSSGSYGYEIEEKTIHQEENYAGKIKTSETSNAAKASKPGRAAGTDPKRVAAILTKLDEAYGDATCELKHENAFQLLISTILSAQCTDVRVNQVAETLYKKYPDARSVCVCHTERAGTGNPTDRFFSEQDKIHNGSEQSDH